MDLIAWSCVTFGNTRTCLDAKQGELKSLMEAGYGQNVERIHGVKKEINELLHHDEVFWRQRYPSSCRQGIKIQNFSIKGRASNEERTTLGDCMIGKESGTPMRIELPTSRKTSTNSYSHLPLHWTWMP